MKNIFVPDRLKGEKLYLLYVLDTHHSPTHLFGRTNIMEEKIEHHKVETAKKVRKMSLKSICFVLFLTTLFSLSVAFSGPRSHNHHHHQLLHRTNASSRSSIFRSNVSQKRFAKRSSSSSINRIKEVSNLILLGEEGETNGEANNNNNIPQKTTSEEKPKSGFLTAVLLGPPLIAKFIIVLLVKFLTDLVVFPLLLLYRFARSIKKKLLKLIGKGDNEKEVA